jgi:hypothetical protein
MLCKSVLSTTTYVAMHENAYQADSDRETPPVLLGANA